MCSAVNAVLGPTLAREFGLTATELGFLTGVAFAEAQSFETLVLARALIGLGVSACLMASIQAFVLWFPAERTGTMIALANSIATRRYPREMAGRVNTMLDTFTFTGTFLGQWATGAVLYALWGLWAVQAAGLVWLWSGRRLVYEVK
ncbi:MAG TPA: hypothetical protein VE085_07180 [Burkholderiales bacterium]|nr:hypothetical protein [Burkholderiales bacterium]